jgi:ribonuclease VapC
MSDVILDSSALLAVIHGEPGHDKVTPEVLATALISAVNIAEVQTKLLNSGWTQAEAWEDATGLVQQVVPFSAEQAKMTGNLVAQTRSLGLSLGDRACLAVAMERKARIYTADRSWKTLKLGIQIHVIR